MLRLFVAGLLACLLPAAPALGAGIATSEDMKGLYYYGDALYYAYQGKWFDAIVRLDAQPGETGEPGEPGGESLFGGTGRVAGEWELNYRMHQRAGRAITDVIEGNVGDAVRNDAIFRLARLYFQKDQPDAAWNVIEGIRGAVPARIRPDLGFLKANIALALGRNAEAVAILKDLQREKRLEGFSSYNLGIALLRSGSEKDGKEYLDRTGRIRSDNPAVRAITDKANLVLGELLMSENDFQAAKEALGRVRMSGPFSNRALLSAGWADASRERFEDALVPWSMLAQREVTDPAVQEALLAVPFAYAKLGVYSTAAHKYETALAAFGNEIEKLNASIASIREGKLLTGLLQQEMKQDADWIVRLRELPETPETLYLLDLMASHDFQESLKNYLDLAELRKKLESWSGDLVAFEDIIRVRKAHYDPLLAEIDKKFEQLDARMQQRLEQRARIQERMDYMLSTPRPDLLITAEERGMYRQLLNLEKLASHQGDDGQRFGDRVKRLEGVLDWNIRAEYETRYAAARKDLNELNQELELPLLQKISFVRTRQAAAESYQGYDDVIGRQRLRIKDAGEKVQQLMAQQGEVLERMAINELTRRRDRLEEFQTKARFALADSYDRASKAQAGKRDAQ